ncbi:MAG TPA: hypothetical protein VD813_09595 [Pseudonocardia sp.]|nr:hypothetical protein [Pseudonocardia sp.]
MLTVHCPRHGSRVLLSERRIRAVHNTPDGIVLDVECHDGERILVVTGRRVEEGPLAERLARARRAVAAVRGRDRGAVAADRGAAPERGRDRELVAC